MKESIVFYKSFYDAINALPEENQLELYKTIFEYSFTGECEEIKNPISKAMFTLMKPNIDSANARYNASVENGKKGGRPKKENLEKTQQKPKENPKKTQQKPNKNLNDNDNDNDNVYVNDNYNGDVNDNYNGDVKKIINVFESSIGFLSPHSSELLLSYLDDFTEDMIIYAIHLADENNKRSMNYISGILNNWKNNNIKTIADAKAEKDKPKLKTKPKINGSNLERYVEDMKRRGIV